MDIVQMQMRGRVLERGAWQWPGVVDATWEAVQQRYEAGQAHTRQEQRNLLQSPYSRAH